MKATISDVARTVLIPILLPVFLGCSESGQATSNFASRDSAGIRIWEYEGLPSTESALWTVAEMPSLVIGEEDGAEPFLFAGIRGTVPTAHGGVAVADGLSNEIRFFDRAGSHLRTAGGEGSGPGEFTRLRKAFAYMGDSIAATNAIGSTITVFSTAGELGRAATCQPASPSLTALRVEGALDRGGFLVRAMPQFQTEALTEGYHRGLSVYHMCSSEGGAGPILAELPDLEIETLNQEGRLLSFPLEMGRKAASVIVGNEVLVGVTDRLELWRYGADGVLRGILRVKAPPTPMNEEMKDHWIEHTLETADDQEMARQTRRRYRDRLWPDSLPVFSDLKGDSEGNLWVRRFAPDYMEGPSEWWVFAPDGTFRARAALPESLRVEAIGTDFVLGVMADELGVERVVRYQLERGPNPRIEP